MIYFVVAGGTILFTNIIRFYGNIRKIVLSTVIHAIEMLTVSTVVILPFTIQFKTMVSGVGVAQRHSLFYQLLVLWGLPSFIFILLFTEIVLDSRKKEKGVFRRMVKMDSPELFALILGQCAMGLVAIPEFVYVKDIYTGGNERSNTMFKLTYQAYMMFGIMMGYGIYRLLFLTKRKTQRILASVVLCLLISTGGYFVKANQSWCGDPLNPDARKGLNALEYLERDLPEDAKAIRWVRANIEGSPVMLEANGDSYSTYERVSASSGLPTIVGWYVHEWLWRNDTADLDDKISDIRTIYTSDSEDTVQELLEKYNVSYIFIGSKEREKYGEELNASLLMEMGSVVYRDPSSGTCIVKIG